MVIGILAHVDAGKTTLSEALLYRGGCLRKLGRVDHQDAFLDTDALERERGITIFSKQARLMLPDAEFQLLDTPGHADFSAEMERTLQVLDYAILVISGTDGVQSHTRTVWRLLRRWGVPVFLFVNKMDLAGADAGTVLAGLRRDLDEGCVAFHPAGPDFAEEAALRDETVLERYLETGTVSREDLTDLIWRRRLFPVWFGSALKLEGVDEFLEGLRTYTRAPDDPAEFGARVFKISRDAQGARLTWMKITGGTLKVKAPLSGGTGETAWEEKADQLRLYSGAKFRTTDQAPAGTVCAVTGLSHTLPGQGLGFEDAAAPAVLEPVLTYQIQLPEGCDPHTAFGKFRELEEEDPQLHILWQEQTRQIHVQLMGEVQLEVLQRQIRDRFGLEVAFGAGSIVYRETIADTVEGIGHFEPLRHYAEVHLLLEPGERGSGLQFATACPEDQLDRNWQRLILTHLAEKKHLGVLTGSPLTDVKITLAAGKAHLKHTEGGDFRQATYRAVRQGLMQAKSVLLEPYYAFSLTVPPEQIGRAINDLRAMGGEFSSPEDSGGLSRIEGSAPVCSLGGYMNELAAYSHGRGRLFLRPDGYRPCKNSDSVIKELAYDAQSDTENPADSVFCAHGAGFNVKWDQVPDYMHLESCLKKEASLEPAAPVFRRSLDIDERELEAIMEREFGPIRRREYRAAEKNQAPAPTPVENKKEYIIVDGYNVIFAWNSLKALAKEHLDLARGRLMDMLSNYCGFTRAELVLVFDGYRSPGNPGSRTEYHNIHVAYTKDGETADAYIERLANDIGKNYSVRVITSDNLIRLSALRSGVLRTSSREFEGEVDWVLGQIEEVLRRSNPDPHKTRLKDGKQ